MLFRMLPTRFKNSSPIIKKNQKQIFRKSKIRTHEFCFSPNALDALVEVDMTRLTQEVGGWKGPIIVAGDFNSKARAWTAGPQDSRGNFLEELMAEYNLTAVNQPGVYTYEKEASRSVLNFTFASPEIMRGIVEWEVLDEETLSDHRYVFVKIAGNRIRGRENQTRGGWSLRKLNNEVFLQTISAVVDVRDHQLAEQATEAAMQVIVEAWETSMPHSQQTTTGSQPTGRMRNWPD